MLVFSRYPGESAVIYHDVQVTVVEVRGKKVRLGFTARPEFIVLREEVYEKRFGCKPNVMNLARPQELRPSQIAMKENL